MPKIKLDDIEYNSEDMSDEAKAQLISLQFTDSQIKKLKQELAVSETARQAYIAALKREIRDKGILPIDSQTRVDDEGQSSGPSSL